MYWKCYCSQSEQKPFLGYESILIYMSKDIKYKIINKILEL